ncbi:hypothetical protein NKI51_28980 [Mesorhizobium australicum]|uniref:hypothetical protein n=1 Tax=Mesorhizobium australicum TaxID=536018 RepID=UPI003334C8A2
MSERRLTLGEVALGRSVYGDAIDYSKVPISDKSLFGPLIDESRAHTPFGTMHFPGTSYSEDFSKEPITSYGYSASQRTFIHELAHVLQYQQGVNVALRAVLNRDYDYGAVFKDVSFSNLGLEKKAMMIEDYFALTHANAAHPLRNTSQQSISEYEKRLPAYVVTSPNLPDQAPIPRSPDGSVASPISNHPNERGGSEFGGNSQPGGGGVGNTLGGSLSAPSQSRSDARASDRSPTPDASGSRSKPAHSPASTRPGQNTFANTPALGPVPDTRYESAPAETAGQTFINTETGVKYKVDPDTLLLMPVDPFATQSITFNMDVPGKYAASFGSVVAGFFGGIASAIGGLVGGIVSGIAHAIGDAFGGGSGGGGSDHSSSPSSGSSGHHSPSPVGDHNGHPSGISGDKDNGWNGHPVLLDLSGNGLSINPLSSSSQFLDLEGDGYQHRTAWAGAGNGVLVLDADSDGKISRSSEFVFTEWDQTATSDLEALKSVFDANHNGLLDAGDARWSEFKVMVDGKLVSLDSLGIKSIGLTARGSGQQFSDGSAITGTSLFTRTDGTNGGQDGKSPRAGVLARPADGDDRRGVS